MDNKKSPNNLIWLDLEMTGLDHNTDVILEIATIATNKDLEIIARGPTIAIHQPESKLSLMDAWCIKTHTNSGLVNRVRESKVTVAQAEEETLEFIRQWIPEKQSPLCGNSIGTDRRFMFKYMPKLDNYFHYRVVDVSTIKELALRWRTDLKQYEKRNYHLATEDVEDSIEELKYYIGSFISKDKSS
ncbi:MAG: oligoribonuclease [Gammaproteobacteria bacterium]|nr:oligoribonuclease [Gammaproteobacteria bacterium]